MIVCPAFRIFAIVGVVLSAIVAPAAAQSEDFPSCPLDSVENVAKVLSGGVGNASRLFGRGKKKRQAKRRIQELTYVPAYMQGGAKDVLIWAPGAKAVSEDIRDRLLAVSTIPLRGDVPEISITAEPTYNAQVHFDQHILISHEVFRAAVSDDEIAFLIAHELSHVLMGHTNDQKAIGESLDRVRWMQRGLAMASKLASTAVAADGMESSAEAADKLDDAGNEADSIAEKILDISDSVIRPAWTRDQEDAADFYAQELMLRAGYSSVGVFNAMTHMAQSRAKQCRLLVALNSSADEVLAALDKLSASDFKRDGVGFTLLTNALESGGKVLEKKVREAFLAATLPSTHRPFPERIDLIVADRLKPENITLQELAENANPSDQAIARYTSSSGYRQVDQSLDAATAVKDALNNNDLQTASRKINQVNMQSSYGRLLKAKVREALGDDVKASQNLKLALAHNGKTALPTALKVYEKQAAYLLADGRLDDLETMVASGERRFGDPDHFKPERIAKAAREDDSNKPTELAVACEQTIRSDLWSICLAARKPDRVDFRTATDEILAELKCSDRHCSESRAADVLVTGTKNIGKGVLDRIRGQTQ